MSAGKLDFLIEQNATFTKVLTYYSNTKIPVDLTGYSAHLQVKDVYGTLLLDLSTLNGLIVLGGTAGTISLTVPAVITSTLTFTNSPYDLTLTGSDGTVVRLLEGSFSVSPGQTV
jgi:FlaG/FlaF family flagellin (archaellin)